MIAPHLDARAVAEEIRRIGEKHERQQGDISQLIVLLARKATDRNGLDARMDTVDQSEFLLCLNVLELLLLHARSSRAGGTRVIDSYRELPGFTVLEGVFSPEFATDSYLWAQRMVAEGRCKNKTVLEMGTGTGLIALLLLLYGGSRHVTAVDINPAAIANVRFNRDHLGLPPDRLTIVESDLFERVPLEQRYDVILWAMPWVHVGGTAANALVRNTRDDVTRRLLQSVLDVDFSTVRRFISGAKERLQPEGEVLLITCDQCRNDVIERHAVQEGFGCEIDSVAREVDVVPQVGMVLNLQQIRLRLL